MSESIKTKFCVECYASIPFDAIKCSDCNSFQDWRRRFVVSQTVLALIIALFAVSAQTIPVVQKALRKDDSIIDYVTASVDHDKVYFLVSNTGTKAGTFNGASLFFLDLNLGWRKVELVPLRSDEIFLKPDTSKLIPMILRQIKLLENGFQVPDRSEWTAKVTQDMTGIREGEYMMLGYYSTHQGIKGSLKVYTSASQYYGFLKMNFPNVAL